MSMIFEEIERTADESDRASHIESSHNLECLQRIRELTKPESHPAFDGKHCVDCDDLIPKVRLGLGRVHCVSCQTKIERAAKLRRN